MTGRPQNSARGFFAKDKIAISDGGSFFFNTYSETNALLTGNASGLKIYGGLALSTQTDFITQNTTSVILPTGVTISAAQLLTGNSTGLVHGNPEAAIPTTDEGAAWTMISNSTGAAIAVNTTGTTWKYLNVTSVQPT